MAASGTVLVTGASGFLGAWIIRRLRAEGREVVALDLAADPRRLALVLRGETISGVRWVGADITDAGAVLDLVAETRPEAIIHLAGLLIPTCRADPLAGVRVNLLGHTHVFEAARRHGVARVIYTSSAAAKPRGEHNRVANLYGATKAAGEEIARFYAEDHGLASLGLRPVVVYGVGRDGGETAVATLAMRAAALGEAYEIPWSSRTVFQLGRDVGEAFVKAALTPFEGAVVSDITTDTQTMVDVLAAIKAAVPDARITLGSVVRPSPETAYDNAPLKRIIGPVPATTLDSGTAETIAHFKALRTLGMI